MAVKYLRSAATGTGTGADWTNAYTTLVAALAGVAAGDTIYVSQAHAESSSSSLIFTSPGTAGSPVRILCVNDGATPPTALSTGATITTTVTASMTFAAGFSYLYGITFVCGSGSTNAVTIFFISASVSMMWEMDTCALQLATSNAASRIYWGTETTSGRDIFLKFNNTTVQFNSSSQGIQLEMGRFVWQNTPSAITGATLPTTLFLPVNPAYGIIQLTGVDLSALGSGKSLINAGAVSIGGLDYYLRNCQLGASVAIITGAIQSQGAQRVFVDNSDSGNTNYRMEHYKYEGKILSETTVVKTSGASDGTTPLSHKFISLATGPSLFSPLEGPWINIWNDTTGSSKTVTVEFLHDSLTNLQNSDIYLEVEGLGTASLPQSVYYSSRVADVFAAPADCAAGVGTGSWTTTGLTNPNSQKLSVTFTPRIKGPVRLRVCLVKANYTVYVDPQASGLTTVSRAYLMPPGMYMNETSAGAGGVGMIKSRVVTGF